MTTEPKDDRSSDPLPPKYLTVAVLGGAAAATFFLSALFDSLAGDAHDDATSLAQSRACGSGPSCSAFDAKRSDAKDDRIVSGVMAGVGGASLVAAAIVWFVWPSEDGTEPGGSVRDDKNHPKSSSWIAPDVGPHGASLTAGVRF